MKTVEKVLVNVKMVFCESFRFTMRTRFVVISNVESFPFENKYKLVVGNFFVAFTEKVFSTFCSKN